MAPLREIRFETDGRYVTSGLDTWYVAPPGIEIPDAILQITGREIHPSSSCICALCQSRRRIRQETPSYLRENIVDLLDPDLGPYREQIFFQKTVMAEERDIKLYLQRICSVEIIGKDDAKREREIRAIQQRFEEQREAARSERAQRIIANLVQPEAEFYRRSSVFGALDGGELPRASGRIYNPVTGLSEDSTPKKKVIKVEKVIKGRRIRTRPSED